MNVRSREAAREEPELVSAGDKDKYAAGFSSAGKKEAAREESVPVRVDASTIPGIQSQG